MELAAARHRSKTALTPPAVRVPVFLHVLPVTENAKVSIPTRSVPWVFSVKNLQGENARARRCICQDIVSILQKAPVKALRRWG